MTLSHEIMHSRVRSIFHALFGKTWDDAAHSVLSENEYDEFKSWIAAVEPEQRMNLRSSLRNMVLVFCDAVELLSNPVDRADAEEAEDEDLPVAKLSERYSRHKYMAIELMVHFHDYYFIYARQPLPYLMSIWASWIKVAPPYARPLEYLTRSLATVASGTGLDKKAAFDQAKEYFLEAVDALKAAGTTSPLYEELQKLLLERENELRAYFEACYYLIDNVRLFFASGTISERVDALRFDPLAEGSTSPEDYGYSIYVYGEGKPVSPVRFALASLFKTLKRNHEIDDTQWLSAWNLMVISS